MIETAKIFVLGVALGWSMVLVPLIVASIIHEYRRGRAVEQRAQGYLRRILAAMNGQSATS